MTGPDNATRALLWEHRPAPRRGPRPAMSLDAIARAGIAIADADGLAAVTMQRVAAELGFTKMALYRYVPGKDELVALMIDAGLGPPPAVTGGWRAQLESWALQMFTVFMTHPWSLEATVGNRIMGPHELGWLEQAVAALTDTGLDGGEMLDVAGTLVGHVRGIAQQTNAYRREAPDPAGPEVALDAMITTLVRGHEDRFPALVAALASAVAQNSQNQALDFGLHRILDGVELLITGRADGASTAG